MMEGQNEGLKIIKARVEQDKYAAVELKIIKANGSSVLKDLYVEKEFNDGELFVASDNVLVALHRALRNGEVANLELITNEGEVLINPENSNIKQVENNLFIAVKSVSDMISVKNNQALKTDALKVQDIAADSRNIKDQMISTMKATNSNNDGTLNFVFEDAYSEAAIYKIEKKDNKYEVKLVGDKASFIATDGVNVYSHSNIVTDLTKVEAISNAVVTEAKVDITSLPVNENIPSFQFGAIDDSVSMFDKFAPKAMEEENNTNRVVLPEFEKNILDKQERKEASYNNSFFDDVTPITPDTIETPISDNKVNKNQTFDEFFGVNDTDVNTDDSMDVVSYDDTEDQYEQLGEMISKLISEKKATEEKIVNFEDQVSNLEEKLTKASNEIETKTSKVNTLINQNRQLGDDNRTLKNRVNGLEEKTERLETENKKYMQENTKLKDDAKRRDGKLTAMISSVSELLGSYGDSDATYTVKRKVA